MPRFQSFWPIDQFLAKKRLFAYFGKTGLIFQFGTYEYLSKLMTKADRSKTEIEEVVGDANTN